MQPGNLPLLASWQNFYILIGTAAATLTGLMFVATTLVSGFERQLETLNAGLSAFSTPTVVQFCAVLLIAGILSAPWQAYSSVRLVLGFLGLAGVIYLMIVMQRMRNVPQYQTPLKDWLWYMAFYLIAYILLIVAAIILPASPALALYIIGVAMLALLFISIHNAWDLVSFLATERSHPE